jgi:hypothetical protein
VLSLLDRPDPPATARGLRDDAPGAHPVHERPTEAIVIGTAEQAQAEADRRNLAMIRALADGSVSQRIERAHVIQVESDVELIDLSELDAKALDQAAAAYGQVRGVAWSNADQHQRDNLRTTVRTILDEYRRGA